MKIEEKIKELVEGGLFYCINCKNFSKAVYETRTETIIYRVMKTSNWDDVEYQQEDCEDTEHQTTEMQCGCKLSYLAEELLVFYDEEKKRYRCGYFMEDDEEEIKKLNKALKEYALKDMKFKEVEI